jgi:hypothetical protein
MRQVRVPVHRGGQWVRDCTLDAMYGNLVKMAHPDKGIEDVAVALYDFTLRAGRSA